MINSKTKHCHVEVPKQLYRKYSYLNQSNRVVVPYMDKDLILKEKELDLIGAEDFYFSDEMENFLNIELETPLGQVMTRISNINKKELSEKEKKNFKKND